MAEMSEQEKILIKDLKKHIKGLFDFMVDNGYTVAPAPKFLITFKEQPIDDILKKTAYYNPDKKEIVLFCKGRALKDCVRSIAHELIHHRQNLDNTIMKSQYSGEKISEDKKLLKLEAEAYLYGNIAFRNYTESLEKKN